MSVHYTSQSNDWQTCLLNTYLTIPLSANVALSKEATKQCVINEIFKPNSTCASDTALTCVFQLQGNCLSGPAVTNDIKIPVGKLLQGLSYFGIQTAIFSTVSHGTFKMNRSNTLVLYLPSNVDTFVPYM
jgi:hypothetical protein